MTQNDFECEPVEQLEMEVDDIVIHNNDDNDLKSNETGIVKDPFKPIESKHFDKGKVYKSLIGEH